MEVEAQHIKGPKGAATYHKNLDRGLVPSARTLKMCHGWVVQQDRPKTYCQSNKRATKEDAHYGVV